jgi:translation initiation factor 2B subunit (eIF-2B alpha/beta/delta family)
VVGELRASGLDVTLVPDAAMAAAIESDGVELVLVGADRVLRSGAVVNKTGTKLAALAARDAGIPFYCVAATDKISSHASRVRSVLFETTEGALVTGIVTELGLLHPDRISNVVLS